jgi:chromosome segregation ATPase
MQQRTIDLTRELERELLAVRTAYRQLGQRASELANDRDSSQADLAGAKQEIETLSGELARVRDDEQNVAHDFEARLESEQKLRTEVEQQLDALTAQYNEKLEQNGALEQELQSLREDLGRHQQSESALAERNDQILALEQTARKLMDDLQEHEGREKGLTEERDALKQQIVDVESSGEQSRAEYQALAGELDGARQESERLRGEFQDQIAGLERRIEEISAERDSLAQQLDELESELLQATTRQIEELEQTLKHAREAISDVDSMDGGELEAEFLRARDSELEVLRTQLHQLIEERDAAVDAMNQARQENSRLRTTTENLLHDDSMNQHGFLGAIIGALTLGLLIGSGISWLM